MSERLPVQIVKHTITSSTRQRMGRLRVCVFVDRRLRRTGAQSLIRRANTESVTTIRVSAWMYLAGWLLLACIHDSCAGAEHAHLEVVHAKLPQDVATFVEQHCANCHDAATQSGGLDLGTLTYQPDDAGNLSQWVRVWDRVQSGEMPPAEESPLTTEVRKPFTESLGKALSDYELRQSDLYGRVARRRLNRDEYENVVRDLLEAPWLQLKNVLPEDSEVQHCNKVAEALDYSHVQMSRYLDAADYALREVIVRQVEPPTATIERYYAREQPSFVRNTRKATNEPERMVIPVLGYRSQYELFGKRNGFSVGATDPATRELEGFVEIASQYESYWMWFDQFKAPSTGRYKLRFHTFSAWIGPSATEPGMPATWWIPDLSNVSPSTRTEPVTVNAETFPRQYRQLAKFDAPIQPGVTELETWLLQGETIHPDASRFFRSQQGRSRYRNPLATPQGSPGVGFRWLEVEGPLVDHWPPPGHRLLFGDLQLASVDSDSDSDSAETPGIAIVTHDPLGDAERLLAGFLAKAMRRPVTAAEPRSYLPLVERELASGSTFMEAMLTAYTTVLCSPNFLTLNQQPGELDDFALAERLALFLHNTAPDDELVAVAAQGKLHESAVLHSQTERLLNAPQAAQFVHGLTDHWLDLSKVIGVSPDPVLYSDYELDELLAESSLEETRAFITELIRDDLPIRNLVDSEFLMINERLAEFYELPAVDGVHVRRVNLPAGSVRGGLITQASILRVTTNGNNTSPVKRGAWIIDRILGKPPAPPPPNVPAVEPDTRGATTLREQLKLHSHDTSCATCHQHIDPPGFALESFDVAGAWRTRYRAFDPEVLPELGSGHLGQKFEFHYALPVDATGAMPDGTTFRDINEFKRILLQDQVQIARNIASQLMLYATGAPVRFSDRPAIEKILEESKSKEFGFRTLIHAVIQSSVFRHK